MKRFGILFIALLSLCACTNNGPDTPNKIDEPTLLQINENALTVKSTGGEYAFTYVVEGGSEIPEITVTCEDEWIHDFNTSVEGVVSFVVDQNISSSRITRVTIACGKLKDSIVVSQGAMSGNADDIILKNISFLILVLQNTRKLRLLILLLIQLVLVLK